MDRWKSRDGKSQRREEKKKEDQRRECHRRKKIQVREKVGKSRGIVFFQWFVAPEGRKVGSLKRRVRSQLSGWEMNNCMLLWREAHFQVKMYKTPQLGNTFRSCDVEKVHAVVARSTFASEKGKSTSRSEHFWKLRFRKSARRCGAKHIPKSNVQKIEGYGAFFDVQMSFCVAFARDCAPCQKWAKHEGFVAFPKTMAGVGHLKRICKDAFFHGRRSERDMFIGDVRRSRRWFPERGCILGHQIFSLGWWFCVTGAALRMTWPHFFVAGGILETGGVEKSQNALARGWKKSRRIAMLSTSKNEEVSQNYFVFDVVKFKN